MKRIAEKAYEKVEFDKPEIHLTIGDLKMNKKQDQTKTIIEKLGNLSKNNYPDYIPTKEVEVYCKEKPKHSLKELLNKAIIIKQGLISGHDFITARDTLECKVCETKITKHEKDGICSKCNRNVEKEKAAKVLKEKRELQWNTLLKELNGLDKNYKLEASVHNKKYISLGLKGAVDYAFTIYLDRVYSGRGYDSYRSSNYALRIKSNVYDLDARTLRKDFDSPGVAKSLHEKIKSLFERNERKVKINNKEENEENDFIKQIIDELGVKKTDISNVYHSSGGQRYNGVKSRQKEVVYNGKKLSVYPSDKGTALRYTFTITKTLNAEDTKKELEAK